ncbi:hypothetical protein JZ751_017367 [Albula glossodonta]|uniref:Uncharacterized protein n=1 Tax=Albula glossodonta TaxID=121402 RepID=A0A8T2PM74_9TELE|nr:hypothetical protein JZ751_017367 [Albula glossodonta]
MPGVALAPPGDPPTTALRPASPVLCGRNSKRETSSHLHRKRKTSKYTRAPHSLHTVVLRPSPAPAHAAQDNLLSANSGGITHIGGGRLPRPLIFYLIPCVERIRAEAKETNYPDPHMAYVPPIANKENSPRRQLVRLTS